MSTLVSLEQAHFVRDAGLGVIGASLSPPFSVLDEQDGDYHVLIVRGGNLEIVTPYDPNNSVVESDEIMYPVLSPDRSKIIYRMPRLSDGEETLYGVSSGGGTPVAIVTVTGHRMMHPMWHPNSDDIVYSRGESFAFGGSIWKTDYSGAGPTLLYMPSPLGGASGYYCFRPQFNFDGSKIAFILARNIGNDANEGLYVMDADGSNVTQVLAFTMGYRFDGAQHCWANTQNVLVVEFDNDVHVVNADGTGNTVISVGETATQDCRVSKYAWAADDALVYFASSWFNGFAFVYRAYSADPGGGGVVRLNDIHGPYNQQNARNVYRWFVDNRIYFIETFGGGNTGKIASFALDGSGYRVDWLGAAPSYRYLYPGTGFEFV